MNKNHSRAVRLQRIMLCMLILAGCSALAQGPVPAARISVDPARRFQEVDGFGVNFNGSYFRESQEPMIDMLIDDLGATLFRLDAYGSDLSNWEIVNDNDDPQVMNWEFYNDRYSTPNFEASWAAAHYIDSKGGRILLAAIGRVPEWMLDDKAPAPTHRVCNSSAKSRKPDHLNPAMYEEYAEQMVSMAVYARSQAHVNFEYYSPFNEPDCYPSEGPRIDPDEAPQVLETIARRLRKEGLGDVKLVGAEQANVTTNYIGPILGNTELMKQMGVFAFHTYGEESVGPQVARVPLSQLSRTRIWLTEYGDLSDLDKSPENEWKNQSLKATRRALRALNQGANAAFFWDAFDNFELCELRPSFYGLMRNDNHRYSPKKRYYAAMQLYHFVRPGSVRIEASADSAGITVSAFRDRATGNIAIVGVKQGGPGRIQILFPSSAQAPHSWELYQTTRTLDCKRESAITVDNGVAQFELEDEAIFTLVGSPPRP